MTSRYDALMTLRKSTNRRRHFRLVQQVQHGHCRSEISVMIRPESLTQFHATLDDGANRMHQNTAQRLMRCAVEG